MREPRSSTRPVLAGALVATVVMFLLGWWQKRPCHVAGWPYLPELIFGRRCYSDIPVLYTERGFAAGIFPYAPQAGPGLEYPVLAGAVMDLTARLGRWLAPGVDPTGPIAIQNYVELTVLLLCGCALITVWATARTRGRPLDGLLVAVAPTLALAGTINWDLLAVAATALALLAWARDRPVLAGVLIGLGTAAKLYPVLILSPIVLLALRRARGEARRPASRPAPPAGAGRAAAVAVVAAFVTWVAVNLPVAIAYPDGWARFWRFNAERGAEFGSAWYALGLLGQPVTPLNAIASGLFVVACAGIARIALSARTEPSLPVLAFLTVAAFLVTNKVYSPQYVLWLLPLAVLAGASIVEIAVWQLAEVLYWAATWEHLATGHEWHYEAATFLRIGVTIGLAAVVAYRTINPQWTWSLRQVAPSEENAGQPRATVS